MNNNELKRKATDVVLKHLKDTNNQYFRVAGGAPRDWYFGREVNDVDVYTSGVWVYQKNSLISLLLKEGIACSNIVRNCKTNTNQQTTSGYGSGGVRRINKNILKVDELRFTVNINKRNETISFDIIQLTNNATFENIWRSYDLDICMIGYDSGKLYLSNIFHDRYKQKKVGNETYSNSNISQELLNFCKQKHFPKLKKKYPELKRISNGYLWTSYDYKVGSVIPMPEQNNIEKQQSYEGYYQKQNNNPISTSQICSSHHWIPTLLVYNTVWDCKNCGMKKEDFERKLNISPGDVDYVIPF